MKENMIPVQFTVVSIDRCESLDLRATSSVGDLIKGPAKFERRMKYAPGLSNGDP